MPTALFQCFAQVQFKYTGGSYPGCFLSYWPTACFEAQGFYNGTVSMDLTQIDNWQCLFPTSDPASADDYMVNGWDVKCGNCAPQYSQDYPYTFVYTGKCCTVP